MANKKRRILVTGVARWWGALVVQRLAEDPDVADIIGIDIREPRYDLGRADYLKLDIRHSLIGKLVRAVGIDTVVHTLTRVDSFDMDPARAHEMNVIGTLNLLAGCASGDRHRPAGPAHPSRRLHRCDGPGDQARTGRGVQHRAGGQRAAVYAARFSRQAACPAAPSSRARPRRGGHPQGGHRLSLAPAARPAALGTHPVDSQGRSRAWLSCRARHARRFRGLHPAAPRPSLRT